MNPSVFVRSLHLHQIKCVIDLHLNVYIIAAFNVGDPVQDNNITSSKCADIAFLTLGDGPYKIFI